MEATITERLQALMDAVENGEALPWSVAERTQPGYWDEHYDFRTEKPSPRKICVQNGNMIMGKGICAHARNIATGSCPSGPCGRRLKLVVNVTTKKWSALKEKYYPHAADPRGSGVRPQDVGVDLPIAVI